MTAVDGIQPNIAENVRQVQPINTVAFQQSDPSISAVAKIDAKEDPSKVLNSTNAAVQE